MRDLRTLIRLLPALALCLAGASAFAQGAASAGNPLDALPRAPETAPPRTEAQITPSPAPAQAALAAPVTPTRFDIEGVKSIPFAEVAALFAPMVGKPVTVGAIVEQAGKGTAMYRARGYALSFLFIPAQPMAGGVVRVVAVEGHVSKVTIEGDAGKAEAKIRDVAQHILDEKPLTLATFERHTALLGRLPGVGVQAEVPLPSSTDGATVLKLKVQRKPYSVSIGSDLRQPQSRGVITGSLNDPLFSGSQLSVSTLLTGEESERLGSVQYLQAIGNEGLTLKASFSTYRGDPDAQLGTASVFERDARNVRRELSASYPLQLSGTMSFVLSGGIYSVDNIDTTRNPANGAFLSEDTRVRAAFAQLAYADAAAESARSISLMLSRGLGGAGAGNEFRSNLAGLSGPGAAKVDFTRLMAEAQYARRFGGKWGTAVSFAGQYSPDALPSTERISFGGSRFARGYAPGATAGDRGWGLGLEFNRSFVVDGTAIRQVQPYVLFEVARVDGELATPVPSRLASASIGFRVADLKYYSADLALSKPVGDRPLENPQRKSRLSLLLSWRFGDV
jgi:hemolysin activation/secretion protein